MTEKKRNSSQFITRIASHQRNNVLNAELQFARSEVVENYRDSTEIRTIVTNTKESTNNEVPMQTAIRAYFFASAEAILAELTSPRAR